MMLIGKRVELKPVTPENYELLTEWLNQPEFWGNFFNIWPQTRESVDQMVHEYKEGAYYIIQDRASKEPLGLACYFSSYVETFYRAYEIGYIIHQSQRGKRVATQAACLLINHLFNTTPIERIMATVVVENDASCRVLERSGMTHEGVERKKMFLHGEYHDTHLLSITRSDWINEQEYRKGREF
jgi:ribosomal-protein-alanine N-acetyltransferase